MVVTILDILNQAHHSSVQRTNAIRKFRAACQQGAVDDLFDYAYHEFVIALKQGDERLRSDSLTRLETLIEQQATVDMTEDDDDIREPLQPRLLWDDVPERVMDIQSRLERMPCDNADYLRIVNTARLYPPCTILDGLLAVAQRVLRCVQRAQECKATQYELELDAAHQRRQLAYTYCLLNGGE